METCQELTIFSKKLATLLGEAYATYDDQFNHITFADTHDDIFEKMSDGMRPAAFIIHELRHALEDRDKDIVVWNKSEARAHTVEVFYDVLIDGLPAIRSKYENVQMGGGRIQHALANIMAIYGIAITDVISPDDIN